MSVILNVLYPYIHTIFPSHGALLSFCILDEGVDVIALRDHMTGPTWTYDGLL